MSNNDIIIRKERDDDGIDNFFYVKATRYGEYLDLMACINSIRKHKNKPKCKKVEKGKYINTVTNEYIMAKQYSSRGDNYKLLKKSADELYKLIHYNFYKNKGIHAVLTYRVPPADTKEVYHDFKIFWQKIRYHYPSIGYISILEPTQKGVWHIHLLLKDVRNKNLYISFYKIREYWDNGICYISKMRENIDYGQYFRKKITADNELLKFYQPGVRYFRHSRNIKKPATFQLNKLELESLIKKGNYKLVDQYSLSINKLDYDGSESALNKIFYKKLKKEKNQNE